MCEEGAMKNMEVLINSAQQALPPAPIRAPTCPSLDSRTALTKSACVWRLQRVELNPWLPS